MRLGAQYTQKGWLSRSANYQTGKEKPPRRTAEYSRFYCFFGNSNTTLIASDKKAMRPVNRTLTWVIALYQQALYQQAACRLNEPLSPLLIHKLQTWQGFLSECMHQKLTEAGGSCNILKHIVCFSSLA